MNWEIIKIATGKTGKSEPRASVANATMSLSTAACEMVENFGKYKYAILMKSRKNGSLCIGIKLLEEQAENALKISRRKYNGKEVEHSFSLTNKAVMEQLFGVQATNKSTVSYRVTIDDEDETVFVIYT